MSSLTASIVIPLYNERAIVDELVERALRAMDAVPGPSELVLVDDASVDGTGERLTALAGYHARLRTIRLARNLGQYRATLIGISAAKGACIVTLDGDLQDPPEQIPLLVTKLLATPNVDVVFAHRTCRDDPWWHRLGADAYGRLQRALNGDVWPGHVGSFAAMQRRVALNLAESRLRHANVAAVLVGLGVRHCSVPYERAARTNGNSRVGLWRLSLEALSSLQAARAAPMGRTSRRRSPG